MCGILYDITQTYGVTVAQVILVHFVEVRILVGLPFFCGKRAASRCRTAPLSQFDRVAPSGFFLFARCFQQFWIIVFYVKFSPSICKISKSVIF